MRIVCQAGRETAEAAFRRGNKQVDWRTQQCTNAPKYKTNQHRPRGSETKKTRHPATQARTHIQAIHTARSLYLGFYLFPLISSLFKTLTLTYSSNDAGRFPTHMQNSYLRNKTQRASGCVILLKHWNG